MDSAVGPVLRMCEELERVRKAVEPTLLACELDGGLALVLSRPCPATDEANACAAPMDWSALVLVSIGLMGVLIGTWFGSFVITALFMPRYVFPTTAAWGLVGGAAMTGAVLVMAWVDG